ncbi:LysR family transcriptional regulator [Paenibacillus sp. SC116]|uniref:LysR family transcriptional regulator n=1 Tax=Paenibacillus sp. SC116 TaxID=2968986 RepID=UPI00215B456A|nr:LysR family transcriptional regulator [Paenibacillus sp. SC116]MCR8844532.1 LysR family transcriptional regulator [Paenibacillus sp. SC116]
MNLDQMHYIVEVAKTKSLLSAANNLHVTQSAISQSITNLEEELGIKIFNRSRMGSIPTPEGKSIIKKALEVIRTIQDIKDEAKYFTEVSVSKLRIATIPGVMFPLVRTVASLKKEYPSVHFGISERDPEEILAQIRKDEVDLGLISMYQDMAYNGLAGLHFEPIWKGNIVLGVWRNSPLASKKQISPEEMVQYPFALLDIEYTHKFINDLDETVGPVNVLFSSNNAQALTYALKEELAITVGYDFSIIDHPLVKSGDLVLLEITGLEQKPLLLGWVRAENSKTSLISKQFMNRFEQEIGLGYL